MHGAQRQSTPCFLLPHCIQSRSTWPPSAQLEKADPKCALRCELLSLALNEPTAVLTLVYSLCCGNQEYKRQSTQHTSLSALTSPKPTDHLLRSLLRTQLRHCRCSCRTTGIHVYTLTHIVHVEDRVGANHVVACDLAEHDTLPDCQYPFYLHRISRRSLQHIHYVELIFADT